MYAAARGGRAFRGILRDPEEFLQGPTLSNFTPGMTDQNWSDIFSCLDGE